MALPIQHDPSSGLRLDPITESMVRLQGKPLFESLDDNFPSTVPGISGSPKKPGRIGPYLIEAELGRGGMGMVYRAHDARLNRTVALKVILSGAVDHKNVLRFLDEATSIAKLQHPNIVQVFDVGAHGEVPYMALEYIDQGSLHRKTDGKPQDPRYAAHLVAAMADGIQHAHEQGILHRDLKPANILLRRREDASTHGDVQSPFLDEPVISDFGLAKRLDSREYVTRSGQAIGTPNYMSPEQAAGQKEVIGPASDIYGLGAILYELLTGRPPFQGVNPLETMTQVIQLEPVPLRQFLPNIPIDLETICLQCLQKDPAKRYASAAELAADLRRFLQNQVIVAQPASRRERLTRWCNRHPLITGLIFLLGLFFVGGLSITSYLAWQQYQRACQLQEENEQLRQRLNSPHPKP